MTDPFYSKAPFDDASVVSITSTSNNSNSALTHLGEDPKPKKMVPRGGILIPFPVKLHSLLESNNDEFSNIISWMPHGRCFRLHNPHEFLKRIMPHHFKQTKLTSFQRQLNLYGFNRITSPGPDRGGYYHELFLRGKSSLAASMVRCRIKGAKRKRSISEPQEPDFYTMPFMDRKSDIYRPPSLSTGSSSSCSTTDDQSKEDADDIIMTFEGMEFHYLESPILGLF